VVDLRHSGREREDSGCGLTYGVNRRCRSGAAGGDEDSRTIAGEVAHRGNVRVERLVRLLGVGEDRGLILLRGWTILYMLIGDHSTAVQTLISKYIIFDDSME
jgi:hypothetical protein